MLLVEGGTLTFHPLPPGSSSPPGESKAVAALLACCCTSRADHASRRPCTTGPYSEGSTYSELHISGGGKHQSRRRAHQGELVSLASGSPVLFLAVSLSHTPPLQIGSASSEEADEAKVQTVTLSGALSIRCFPLHLKYFLCPSLLHSHPSTEKQHCRRGLQTHGVAPAVYQTSPTGNLH